MKNHILKALNHKNLIWWSLTLSFCLFLLNLIHNINFYFPDEHFQIIEFAAFKQNLISAHDLAWEYAARERQALQPFIAYCVFQILGFLSIDGHTDQMVILKLLNSIFTLFCIYRFVTATLYYFTDEYKPFYILTSFLIWFVPCFFIRFSSETFSQSLLLLACSYFFAEKQKKYALETAGFILGFVFFARFQSALSMLGLFLGLYISYGYRLREYFKIALGSLLPIAICVVIDYWFYNEWVFTPWRYFNFQLLHGVAAEFGVSPFYQYFIYLFNFSTPVFGLLFLVCFLAPFIAGKVLNPIYLTVFFTIILLSLVSHKEFRFLMAIMLFFPFVLVFGIQSISSISPLMARIFHQWYIIGLFVVISGWFTVKGIFVNNDILSSNGGVFAYVTARDYADRKIALFHFGEDPQPFCIAAYVPNAAKENKPSPWLCRKFLMHEPSQSYHVERLEDPRLFIRQNETTNLLYINKALLLSSPKNQLLLKKSGYRRVGVSVPAFTDNWIDHIPIAAHYLDSKITYLFALE